MSDFDPRALARIREHLAGVDELWRRREAALRAPSAPGSLGAADANLPDARWVTIFAGHATAAALDHLTAWRSLVHSPVIPIAAHLMLLRGVLESADRARWHVDAAVDPGTRVGRGFASRRDDQDERRKFEASREHPPAPPRTKGKTALERLEDLDDPTALAARVAAGVRIVGYTDTTRLMVTYGHERWYRIASGLAHAREWATQATNLEPETVRDIGPGTKSGTFNASEPVALALTIVAVEAMGAAVADLEAYRAAPRVAPRRS